jgi:hypothetical protein
MGFIVNGNYIHSIINHNIEDVNTFGGAVGMSLTIDKDIFVIGVAVSYQYNADNINSPNDHQHLIKIGGNVGVRIGKIALSICSAPGIMTLQITNKRQLEQITIILIWESRPPGPLPRPGISTVSINGSSGSGILRRINFSSGPF